MKAVTLALIIVSGCVVSKPSGTSQEPPQGPTARELFERDVYPILQTDCGGCHAASQVATLAFLGTDADATYDRVSEDTALVGDFSVDHAPIAHPHGTTHPLQYTHDELAKITAWLEAEMNERR